MLSLSPTKMRRLEAMRDTIFRQIGTDEAAIEDIDPVILRSRQWRKPLSIPEINRLAPTAEVRERRGRP